MVLEIRNHKAAIDYIREEARTSGSKASPVTLTTMKRIHDLLLGNTPEAQAMRAQLERRERTEKELAKERERAGLPARTCRCTAPTSTTSRSRRRSRALLEKLVDFTADAEFREYHPIKQAATFQHQFLQIFPFTRALGEGRPDDART